MSNNVPQFLVGMTVFVNGEARLGKGKNVTLPKVEQIRETFKAGGFERSVGTGVFKAMEAEITLTEYHKSVVSVLASLTNESVFVVKGSIKEKNKHIPVVATFKGEIDADDGSWETGKEIERKIKIYIDKYSLEIDGKPHIVLDTENMIALIDGVDHMEKLRKHIL